MLNIQACEMGEEVKRTHKFRGWGDGEGMRFRTAPAEQLKPEVPARNVTVAPLLFRHQPRAAATPSAKRKT